MLNLKYTVHNLFLMEQHKGLHLRGAPLTRGDPWCDTGDGGVGDMCVHLYRLIGLFQQVPHLYTAVLFPKEKNSWSGQGPASCSAHLRVL